MKEENIGRPSPAAPFRESLSTTAFSVESGKTLEQAVTDYERSLIISALSQANDDLVETAKLLGSTLRVITSKIVKLGIRLPVRAAKTGD